MVPTEGGETEGGGHRRPGAMPWLPVKEDGMYLGVSLFLYYYFFNFANDFLREGRRVCKACTTAKRQCAMVGGDTIKVSWKKMEDVEEGSSGRKKWKRKEEEEIKAKFGLVVEELWGQVERWEESERWQEQRWATVMATLERITDDVRDLLDRLVLEEKEKGKEIGVETDAEEMEMEEMGEAEEAEELGEMGAGTEKDGDGEMEVEETLKEMEKSADEGMMEE